MFKKNDPLVNAVQKIMQENAIRFQAERELCEELGIYSKNELPNEHKVNFDALLEQKINEALHPNQQKLDVHEPEKDKLTAQDFKMLRSKKTVKEEEQLDEGNAANKEKKNAAAMAVGAKNTDAQHLGSRGMKTSVADKIRGREKMSGNDRKQFKEEDTSSTDPDMAAPSKGPGYKDEIKPKVSASKEGPSASDREALTNKIKGVMKEAKEKMEMDEAAKSKSQQRLFGAALATRRGESEPGSRKIAKLAADVPEKELEKFAGTKLKGLPNKVK
jgi:hypothetical protein